MVDEVLGERVRGRRPLGRRDETSPLVLAHAGRALGQHVHATLQERDRKGRVLVEVVGEDDAVQPMPEEFLPVLGQHRTGQLGARRLPPRAVAVAGGHHLHAEPPGPARQVQPSAQPDHPDAHAHMIVQAPPTRTPHNVSPVSGTLARTVRRKGTSTCLLSLTRPT